MLELFKKQTNVPTVLFVKINWTDSLAFFAVLTFQLWYRYTCLPARFRPMSTHKQNSTDYVSVYILFTQILMFNILIAMFRLVLNVSSCLQAIIWFVPHDMSYHKQSDVAWWQVERVKLQCRQNDQTWYDITDAKHTLWFEYSSPLSIMRQS